jgi:hypothetical protein
MKKLLTFIYKNQLGDCTNNGLSSKVDSAYITWGFEIFSSKDQMLENFYNEKGEDFFVIKEHTILGKHSKIAVPYSIYKTGRHSKHGGNFLYTSDPRFPNDAPIPIHDRVE